MSASFIAVLGEITTVDDSQPFQQVQILGLAGEVLQLPRLQQAGITSVPPIGTEVLVLFINGRSHGYVVAEECPDSRPNSLQPGDVALYAQVAGGATLKLLASGAIELTPASGQPVTVNGDLVATGQVSDANGSMQEMRNTYNAHTHASGPTPDQAMT